MPFRLKFTCPFCGAKVYHDMDESEAAVTTITCFCGYRYFMVPAGSAPYGALVVGFTVSPCSEEAMRVSRGFDLVSEE